jgi:polysaccharide pyruvyl transferase WcaK-like protein
MRQIADADVIVASRFHGVLLSYLLGKLALGVSYHSKTAELMREMGQAEFCIDIEALDLAALSERFERLRERGPSIRRRTETIVTAHRRALENQYELVLGAGALRHASTPVQSNSPSSGIASGAAT